MQKITETNLNMIVASAIIANYPVQGEAQQEFEDGDNVIAWTVMAKNDNQYRLATSYMGAKNGIARNVISRDTICNGCWWYYEQEDLLQ